MRKRKKSMLVKGRKVGETTAQNKEKHRNVEEGRREKLRQHTETTESDVRDSHKN